jgi:hypothetical protein
MLLHSAMLHLRLSSHDTFQKTGVLDCLKYTNKRGLSGLDFLRVLSCPTPMILWQVAFLYLMVMETSSATDLSLSGMHSLQLIVGQLDYA